VSTPTKFVGLAVVTVLCGLGGFSFGYASPRKRALESLGSLEGFPAQAVTDLAYAFAPPAQVKAMIGREPPQPAAWAHAEAKVELLRKLRLAVVAESSSERSKLLAQAHAICKACNAENIQRMFQGYAQDRLVPPGNDIICDDCSPPRQRKALPPPR
jgi:hypothetical protein